MQHFPPTLILRHNRENLKKCSLRGLEQRKDMVFLTYPTSTLPDLARYCVLTLDAPLLTLDDAHLGLFLIDGTWRYAEKMAKSLYCHRHQTLNLDSARQSPIEALRSERGCPSPDGIGGKGDEEDRLGKVTASPNSKFDADGSIPPKGSFEGPFAYRSLPTHFQTAYPRRQLDCPDPERGLASVEALYLAYSILGRSTEGILDHYHWKELFLKNHSKIRCFNQLV